jgi:squalene synthase HpnC
VAANAAGENFPVALRLLPARHRRHLTALYCFARLTDDLGDEAREANQPSSTGLRLRLLDELAADVDRIYDGGTPASPVMRTMAKTVRECKVPAQPLHDLIQANRQDQQVTRYRTFAELARYCELSANPVGQIVLYIFGAATPERIAASDRICTALQLAEHWQDVAEDLRNGRIYLPAEDLQLFGVQTPFYGDPAAIEHLVRFEAARARDWFGRGLRLLPLLDGRSRACVLAMTGIYRRILERIEADPLAVSRGRVRLEGREKLVLAARSLAGIGA